MELTPSEDEAQRSMNTMNVRELFCQAGNISDVGQAIALYKNWIDDHPNDPLLHAACFNYAALLSNNGDSAAAKPILLKALELDPRFIPAQINLGFVLERLGQTSDAATQWLEVVNQLHAITPESINHKLAALKQIGRVLEAAHLYASAEAVLRMSLELVPNQADILQHWLGLRHGQCKWPLIEPLANLTRTEMLAGLSPLSMAVTIDDPLLQLGHAARYARGEMPRPKHRFDQQILPTYSNDRPNILRIGYLSSDLREHAIGFLMAELFGLHDRERFEVFIYNAWPYTNDAIQQRIRDSTDHWRDIAAQTDLEVARQIIADDIAILVDVNGHMQGSRPKLLTLRPAPVIVNWLGYPGTTGSACHTHIIADAIIIPPEHEIFYSERVLRLPCYQPNDRQRAVAPISQSRADAGLPEQAMVYCCFNGAHKITRPIWEAWMRILQVVPNSVLWLLNTADDLKARLIEYARQEGVTGDRLVFAAKLRNAEHLARYRLADLFLDTSPYGAHTTASDALWMGVPVLTLCGRSFASRVCSSLVSAAGVPDLVCTDLEAYIEQATRLGRDRTACAALRSRLDLGRDSCTLFDTRRLVTHLEKLFMQLSQDDRAGRTPRPDLTNLDIYQEIGLALDVDDLASLDEAAYRNIYIAELDARDRYSPLPPDLRLWRKQAESHHHAPQALES
jgi:predicted O-linked N-acetylglucosamine transferase (SPINDLY family)